MEAAHARRAEIVGRAHKDIGGSAGAARKPHGASNSFKNTLKGFNTRTHGQGCRTHPQLHQAIYGLYSQSPHFSAARTTTTGQKAAMVAAALLIAWSAMADPLRLQWTAIWLCTAIYLGCVLFRGLILAGYRSPRPPMDPAADPSDELPLYTILVALYREANQVGQLCANLKAIQWPETRLEIKLICETVDGETIAALRALELPAHFEIVLVPNAQPRTKPKALNFALQRCRGKYLVLYDAEDHPDPYQLLEAYQTFSRHDPSLACLQAPLLIHNHRQSWLTGLFALEYCTLFMGILPVLAAWRVPLPLGGTSNHFKTDILKKVGGWDPFNVTEDADLGLRLARYGYRSDVLRRPTWEEAPPTINHWLPQRTRWLKGWMQTILVHSRDPLKLAGEIGWRSFLTFHLLMTSIVLSSLLHPLFLLVLGLQLFNPAALLHATGGVGLALSIFIMVGGYTTYAAMAHMVLDQTRMHGLKKWIGLIPVYWLLIALAGWRAAAQLIIRPHYWEKTKHGLANPQSDTTLKRDGGSLSHRVV